MGFMFVFLGGGSKACVFVSMFADVKGLVEIKYQVNGLPEVEDYLIFFSWLDLNQKG